MNYSTLSLKELIHYGELDARTPLELALVAVLKDMDDVTAERDQLLRDSDAAPDVNEISSYLKEIKGLIQDIEDAL